MSLRILKLSGPEGDDFVEAVCRRGAGRLIEAGEEVRSIIERVEKEGDAALVDLARRLDRVEQRVEDLRLSRERLRAIAAGAPAAVREALREAAGRIRRFHEAQRRAIADFEVEIDGIRSGQRALPLDRTGVYVPGGKAAYASTVLMNVLPARVAGVREVAVATPPGALERNPAVAAAIELVEADEVYAVGGAQAIAALALGTATVRPVDKIVGPGNVYVNAAKRLLSGRVGIDALAGPSEVLVVADGTARPEWVAADLLAQAEHDEEAAAMALVPSRETAVAVREEVERSLATLPRGDIARASLERNGAILVYETGTAALSAINRLAPEHLSLHVRDPRRWYGEVRHAGSAFLGELAAEVLGDYGCGPNHVLPTARASRHESALGVMSFLRFGQWLECGAEAARAAAPMVEALARAEGLEGHARAIRIRAGASGIDGAPAGARVPE
jgi:histidinol dehydrogenase